MNSASLTIIGDCLANVAGAIAERWRQESSGSEPNHTAFDECLKREGNRLRGEGQIALADAVSALGATING